MLLFHIIYLKYSGCFLNHNDFYILYGNVVICMYDLAMTSADVIVCTGNRVGITVLQTTPSSADV